MEGITLSSAVRNNLLSMQTTADMMAKTQNRLATGKKVNSALDNPTNFFTASALDSRASDLMRLQDSVSNAIQTIEAADNGIKAINKLVESAQATARQAYQSAKPAGVPANIQGDGIFSNADASGSVNDNPATIGAGEINFNVNGSDLLLTLDGSETLQEIANQISALDAFNMNSINFSQVGPPTKYNVDILETSGVNTITITSVSGTAFADLGLPSTVGPSVRTDGAFVDTSPAGTSATDISGLTGASTLDFNVDGNATSLVLTGSESMDDIASAISGIAGLTATVEQGIHQGEFFIDVQADPSVANFTSSGATSTTLGLNGSFNGGGFVESAVRQNLEAEYNALLTQIDQLTTDASYNGNNFLSGDNLKVIFNEQGTSSLTIKGVDTSSLGLGLSAVASGAFQSNSNLNTLLSDLDSAALTLRSNASTFGSSLSTVQARKDFTNNMINTLETGAANLTLADINKEGANLLALQTRQQLSTTALSMASQADQAVLRLF